MQSRLSKYIIWTLLISIISIESIIINKKEIHYNKSIIWAQSVGYTSILVITPVFFS